MKEQRDSELWKLALVAVALIMVTPGVVSVNEPTYDVLAPCCPYNVWGYAYFDGVPMEGKTLTAWIDGMFYGICTTYYEGQYPGGIFSLDVWSDDTTPDYTKTGGYNGDLILFAYQEGNQTYWADFTDIYIVGGFNVHPRYFNFSSTGGPAWLKINEICTDEGTGSQHVEVFNPITYTVCLDQYYLEKDIPGNKNNYAGETFPLSGSLGPGSATYFDIGATGFLNTSADELKLVWANNGSVIADGFDIVIDRVEYGNQPFEPDNTRLFDASAPPPQWGIKRKIDAYDTDDCFEDFQLFTYTGPVHNNNKDTFYPTIGMGIECAEVGDTITVASGVYQENLVIDKNLTLKGEDRHTTIIDGCGVGDVVSIRADGVNISGFTITNSGGSQDDAGIKIDSDYYLTTQLTDNVYPDWHPKMNELGQVVWLGRDNNDDEIFFFDGNTTIQVTNNDYTDYLPDLNNVGQIAWYGYPQHGSDSEIFFWDGCDITQITDNDYCDQGARINDCGEVAWYGRYSSESNIFIWDGTTTTELVLNNWNDRYLEMNNLGQVVWEGDPYGRDHEEIFLWDGSSIIQLTNNNVIDENPIINDMGHVVWKGGWNSSQGVTSNDIYYWDGTNIIRVTHNNYHEGYPEMNNLGQVVWYSDCGGGDNEIFLWDGNGITQLTDNNQQDGQPHINDNGVVVWGGTDVYEWDGVFRQLTDNPYTKSYTQINNKGDIIWQRYDSKDCEIIMRCKAKGMLKDNIITENIINNNNIGIYFNTTENNQVYHNDFINNTIQSRDNNNNSWDNSYPSGGNYWSDYIGADDFSGPNQDIPGSDGIGDTHYTNIIGGNNVDNYPLMNPWVPEITTATATGPQGAGHDPIITITYDWTETPDAVDLFYSTNNGDEWHYLGTDHSVDGSFDWEPEANPGPKPSKYWWIANVQNGSDDAGIPANGTPPEAGPFNWKTWDVCEDAAQTFSPTGANWYLISVPLDVSGDVLTVFDDAEWGDGGTTWDYIRWFDAAEGRWRSHSIYRPPSKNDMPLVDNSMGIWIHLTSNDGDGVLTAGQGTMPSSTDIQLHAGWNLVGYPSLTEMKVSTAFWGTGADHVMVCDTSEPYHVKEVGPTYMMRPGEGYWIHVPFDTVWMIDW